MRCAHCWQPAGELGQAIYKCACGAVARKIIKRGEAIRFSVLRRAPEVGVQRENHHEPRRTPTFILDRGGF